MGVRRGALSLVLLVGSVNAACITCAPPPAPADPPRPSAGCARPGVGSQGRPAIHRQVALDQDETCTVRAWIGRCTRWTSRPAPVKWSCRLTGSSPAGSSSRATPCTRRAPGPKGRVNALDRSTGQRIWRVNVGLVSAPLAMVDGCSSVANQRGELLGLDPKTGRRSLAPADGAGVIAPIPAGFGGAVLLATPDSLFRIATADGAVRRRVRVAGSGGLALDPDARDALVAGTADSLVLAIDPDSLTPRWKVRLDAPVMDSPAVMGDTIYAATRRGTLYRVFPGTPARGGAHRGARLADHGAGHHRRTARSCWAAPTGRSGRSTPRDGAVADQPLAPDRARPLPLDDGMVAVGGKGDLHRFRR